MTFAQNPQDLALIQSFLKKNPKIQILQPKVTTPKIVQSESLKSQQQPKVQLKKLSSSDIALKKFLLKNPGSKLTSPKVVVQKLSPIDTKMSLDTAKAILDKERTKIRKRMLRDIYYDPAHPAGLGTAEKLFQAGRKKDKYLTREEVQKWISKQRAHYLSKTVRKFPRRKVLVRGIRHQYQADLMDFSAIANYNFGYKYVLTVIDCFSRKAFALPLKSKKGFVLRRALATAFENLGTPKKIQTDQGSEFFNQEVKQLLRENDVAHFYTNQELKAQMVERFNRTLRNKIAKYIFAKDNLRFAPHLKDFIHSYNNSVHSSLKKFTPNQVNKRNEQEVRDILYKDYFSKKKNLHKFKIGQQVRPIIKRDRFKKMEKQFKEDIFIVTDQVESFPPTYQLKKESNNTAVKGIFYEKQLQEV